MSDDTVSFREPGEDVLFIIIIDFKWFSFII